MKFPLLMGAGALCALHMTAATALETEFGTLSGDFRLRYEAVEQNNALEDADAITLRGRLGFVTRDWSGLSFGIEAVAVTAADDDYNSGPNGNGQTAFSVIPDPEDERFNQLWISYGGLSDTKVKLGRQRIILDNARFVGNVGWRQNEQTYDGLSVENSSFENTKLTYVYLSQVNDIFFREMELDGHLLDGSLQLGSTTLGGYVYLLDYDAGAGSDQQTVGVRAKGSLHESEAMKFGYRAEYAMQQDYADAADFDADYYLLEISMKRDVFGLSLGQETLEGDGLVAFQTPLATLHAFNGWADQFLKTPANGLVDRYVGANYKVNDVVLKAFYHDFSSDTGGVNHGSEWNALVAYKPAPGWSILAKYADYQADATSVDTEKLWFQVGYSF